MKKILVLLAVVASPQLWATDGKLAAELYVRSMVKESASKAGRPNELCRQFSNEMNITGMAKKITDWQNAWTNASEGQRSEFKKTFVKFMVDNAIERLTSNTRVTAVSVSGSGSSYTVAAKVMSDSERSTKYWLAVRPGDLNAISDAELQSLASSGSNSNVEAKLKRAFSIYEVQARGTLLTDYLSKGYQRYATSKGRPGELFAEFFADVEQTQGRCP